MKTPESLKKLFDRDHVIRALWSFLIALVFFLAGIWYNSGKEPSRVFVTNPVGSSDTVLIKFDQSRPDGKLTQYLIEVARDLKNFKRMYASKAEGGVVEKKQPVTIEPSTVAALKFEQKRDEFKVPLETVPVPAEIKIPRFVVPASAKGYLGKGLTGLAKTSISALVFTKKSNIEIVVELIDEKLADKISPLIVTALRKKSENSYDWIADQQYVLRPGKNLIRLPADFGIGDFNLEYGFYFLNEINAEYPPFYRNETVIKILAANGS